jgi:hypothetical protein
MNSISPSELMHLQLQAFLRENKCEDIEYLGLRNKEHWYRIDSYEVPVSQIESLDQI